MNHTMSDVNKIFLQYVLAGTEAVRCSVPGLFRLRFATLLTVMLAAQLLIAPEIDHLFMLSTR